MLVRFRDLEDGDPRPIIAWFAQDGGAGGAASGGSGDGGSQGSQDAAAGDAGGGNGDPGDKGTPPADGGDKPSDGDGSQQFVTPQILQGVLDAHKRTQSSELKKIADQQSQLTKTLNALTERLESLPSSSDKGDKGDKDKRAEDSEKVELRRQLTEVQTKLREEKDRAEKEAQQRKDYQFETNVKAALIRAACTNPEEAFLVIKPRLNHDDDGRIFATVKTEWGDTDLELDDYVNREFSEKILPQLFKGKMRAGSPAGGDAGSGGSYEFTREELLDNPERYAADPEKARTAVEKGLVRGLKRPGQA